MNQCSIDQHFLFGKGLNPPSISLGLYACLMAATIYLLMKLISEYEVRMIPIRWIARIGKHSLYIFLYHILFLYFIIPTGLSVIGITDIGNIWIKRVVYYVVMIEGSILIESVSNLFVLYKNRNRIFDYTRI